MEQLNKISLCSSVLEADIFASDNEKICFYVEWSQKVSPFWSDALSEGLQRNALSPGASVEIHFAPKVDTKEKEHPSSYKRRQGWPVDKGSGHHLHEARHCVLKLEDEDLHSGFRNEKNALIGKLVDIVRW